MNNIEEIVYQQFAKNLKSIGVLSMSLKYSGWKRIYLFLTFAPLLTAIFIYDLPLLLIAIPILPLLIFQLLYIIDLNIMVRCLVDIQKNLMDEHDLVLDIHQLLDYLQTYAKQTDFFQIGKR
jgi:hypothetical protein